MVSFSTHHMLFQQFFIRVPITILGDGSFITLIVLNGPKKKKENLENPSKLKLGDGMF